MYITDFAVFSSSDLVQKRNFLSQKKTNLFESLEQENTILGSYKLAAEAISEFELTDVSMVLGETLDPKFRSPSFCQWVLALLNKEMPAFDFITAGTFLSFLGQFKPQFDDFLFLAFSFLEEGAGDLIVLKISTSPNQARIKLVDGEILYSDTILSFTNPCYGNCQLVYHRPTEATVNLVKEKVRNSQAIYPWFMAEGVHKESPFVNYGTLKFLRSIGRYQTSSQVKIVEVGLNGALGFATVEIC